MIFGWSAAWAASILFVVIYVLIVAEKLNRAILALLGAGLMIISGVLTQQAALQGIDFNTIGLLLGMMVIVAITGRSGVFQYAAIWSAKKVKAHPMGVLAMLSVVTAVVSAFLNNVTTMLLIVPVTLVITEALGVRPYPYLISEIVFSNIGGTATLIGDPPNIMIGSAVGLTFNDFLWHVTPVIAVITAVTMLPIYFVYRRELVATPEARRRVMEFNEKKAIQDPRLVKQSVSVICVVIAAFAIAEYIHLEPATVAMFGAAILLLLDNYGRSAEEQGTAVQHAFSQAEWITLTFFIGLFILVRGLENSGVIGLAAQKLLNATRGNRNVATLSILWGSALLSAFIDNIPFVATMIPLIKSLAPAFGGDRALMPMWWALSLGACLGGNGTLIGASANLVVAGMAERAGHPIRFIPFLKSCFLLMLLSVAICHIYLLIRYL